MSREDGTTPGTDYTVVTAGGAETVVQVSPDSAHAYCNSTCGSIRTFWAHLSKHPEAEARGWAQGHAPMCTAPRLGYAR